MRGKKINSKPRRARIREVHVIAINPSRYPQFCKDPDNPYSALPDDVRCAEIEDICAQLLAQACFELAAKKSQATGQPQEVGQQSAELR